MARIAVYFHRRFDEEWWLWGVFPNQDHADITARDLRDTGYPVRGVKVSRHAQLGDIPRNPDAFEDGGFLPDPVEEFLALDAESQPLIESVEDADRYWAGDPQGAVA